MFRLDVFDEMVVPGKGARAKRANVIPFVRVYLHVPSELIVSGKPFPTIRPKASKWFVSFIRFFADQIHLFLPLS